MINIELLKKLTFIADITKKLEPFLFDDIEICINKLLENSDDVVYACQVLKVPFTTYEPENGHTPDEINVKFGCEVGLNIIYQTTYILKEIYGDALDVYISYATEPEGDEKKTIIGTYITRDKDFTNISAPITANEILKLDIKNMDWEEFSSLFPNNKHDANRACTYIIRQENYEPDDYYDDYDHDDYGSSYEKYGGYNGWSDDVIDDAFEGDPMNTWNVD
ncbi:hypothetical protein ING2E5B_0644 [Fermentimonas caenicola]|jgi:hypothetical protein|uniref:Uncharacterized protein n=1 Tax=Fermentimonas caenicola TaxID=1562970 RepID=A0A098BZ13_9BACT|nr:hypothetical protein ING2E5B_0644 [Fermentimonas caenicola]